MGVARYRHADDAAHLGRFEHCRRLRALHAGGTLFNDNSDELITYFFGPNRHFKRECGGGPTA
jgi:hypothetical protein